MYQIVGHGIDVVEVDAFRSLLECNSGDFKDRCFTKAEQAEAATHANEVQRFAGWFAMKEAVAKAMGIGFGGAVTPLDIVITHGIGGAPQVLLRQGAMKRASELRVVNWHVSISHVNSTAFASAIAVSNN